MPGSDLLYLACFDNLEDLEMIMEVYGITYTTVKQIRDDREFLASVAHPAC